MRKLFTLLETVKHWTDSNVVIIIINNFELIEFLSLTISNRVSNYIYKIFNIHLLILIIELLLQLQYARIIESFNTLIDVLFISSWTSSIAFTNFREFSSNIKILWGMKINIALFVSLKSIILFFKIIIPIFIFLMSSHSTKCSGVKDGFPSFPTNATILDL